MMLISHTLTVYIGQAKIPLQSNAMSNLSCQALLFKYYTFTQVRAQNDTSIGTACTRSSATYCGTSTCAKRSKRSGCGASTTSTCLYSRRCTARCFTLYTPIIQTREIFEEVEVKQTITPCRVPVLTALDLPGRAVSDRLCP